MKLPSIVFQTNYFYRS